MPSGKPDGLPSQAKGYGKYCQDQSKKHVAGEKGTPFSQCVRALRAADNNDAKTAKKACKALKGQKHKPHGEKGTAFSRCVKSVAQMRKEQAATVTASAVA